MQEFQSAAKVLAAFANAGFKKTSMEDIAKAMSLSRQSVYKRFGSKTEVYAWAIDCYLADVYSRSMALLEQVGERPEQVLLEAFEVLIGEALSIIDTPFGTQVLDDSLKAGRESQHDWPLRFRAKLAAFLTDHQLASSDKSYGLAFVMVAAGKGVLLEKKSYDQFIQDMQLIIESIKQ